MTTLKRPRGAPKKDNPASERLMLRITPDEKSLWTAAAEKEGKTLSGWLKDKANAAADD